jgi:uncharacterized protein (TIGR02145 family)
MRYRGGIISGTPPTTTTSEAVGVWTMSQQMQAAKAGTWPAQSYPPPTTIGQAYGGGFYAGQIAVGGSGTATHYLIVAPKASGEASGKTWGVYGTATGFTSDINGPANTTGEAALGASYQAATFCNNLNSGGGLNGYTDWYLPAKNELEVLYYFLKPTTADNNTSAGSNANAVSPEPVSTNYTSGSPAQTSATGVDGFRTGETNEFASAYYWSSTETGAYIAWIQSFYDGRVQYDYSKSSTYHVRAVRRIAV